MNDLLEDEIALQLVVLATEYVAAYMGEDDWEAGIVAVLARSLELASGRKLKSLEDVWTTRTLHA